MVNPIDKQQLIWGFLEVVCFITIVWIIAYFAYNKNIITKEEYYQKRVYIFLTYVSIIIIISVSPFFY